MKFTNRNFGVEIEFLESGLTRDQVADALQVAGIETQAEAYNHITRPYWKVITDSSCGFEVVSPILSAPSGFDQITLVCKVLQSLGARVDVNCGLHVHVDARDLRRREIASAFATYARFEKFFDAICPPSRTGSRWCQSITKVLNFPESVKAEFKVNPLQVWDNFYLSDRYHKVNLEAYTRHGTMEFRQAAGTIEAEKIINWVVLMVGLVETCRGAFITLDPVQVSVNYVKKWLNLSTSDPVNEVARCAQWIGERFHKFNPTKSFSTVL